MDAEPSSRVASSFELADDCPDLKRVGIIKRL
jgi:hypothetical protein